MAIRFFSLLISIITATINISYAQSYIINNKSINVKIDYVNNQMKIWTSKDTIHYYDVTDFSSAPELYNSSFLKICYKIRIGSNAKEYRFLLVSVDDLCKIKEAMHVIYHSEAILDRVYDKEADSMNLFEESVSYKVSFSLIQDVKHYQIVARVHHESTSRHSEIDNFKYNKTTTLLYDTKRNVFYSEVSKVKGRFTIYMPSEKKDVAKDISSNEIPTISLGRKRYYYINNQWHEVSANNYLLMLSEK